jgi:nucleoid-associated protein YgaU
MGLFDKMFGRDASSDADSQKRFDELKTKYQSVLNQADRMQLQFQNLHIQDNKLFIKATAPSQDAANKVWDQIKLVNPNGDDIIADITVSESVAQAAAVSGQPQGKVGQTYTVKSGDTLSKISKQYYGNANEYMRIFYANSDRLRDPIRFK